MDVNNLLLDAAMVSIHSLQPKTKGPITSETDEQEESDSSIEEGLHKSMKSINASLKTFNSSRKSVNATYLKSMKRRRRGARSQEPAASDPSHDRSIDISRSGNSGSSQRFNYSGVNLNGTMGSLTLTGERLIFKPRDPRDTTNVYSWPFEAILKHQISPNNSGSCLLRLVSQANPSKAVTMAFPDRPSLENIHSHLTTQLQPLRKYRKLKETLLSTQRKLKEAHRIIDDLHDTNEKLLFSCDALGRKCKSLSEELQSQRREQVQEGMVDERVATLEDKLRNIKPELESLRNEKTAMAICHEMDIGNFQSRIATLEQELAEERQALEEERAATERLLEDRELMDGLQLEVSMLANDLSRERRLVKELRSRLLERDKAREKTVESMLTLEKFQRERNKAITELTHVKRERDNLRQQLEEYRARSHLADEHESSDLSSEPSSDRCVEPAEAGGPSAFGGNGSSPGCRALVLTICPSTQSELGFRFNRPDLLFQKATALRGNVLPHARLLCLSTIVSSHTPTFPEHVALALRGTGRPFARPFCLSTNVCSGPPLTNNNQYLGSGSGKVILGNAFVWKNILDEAMLMPRLNAIFCTEPLMTWYPTEDCFLPRFPLACPLAIERQNLNLGGVPEFSWDWSSHHILRHNAAATASSSIYWDHGAYLATLPIHRDWQPAGLEMIPENTNGRSSRPEWQRQFLFPGVLEGETMVNWNPGVGSARNLRRSCFVPSKSLDYMANTIVKG